MYGVIAYYEIGGNQVLPKYEVWRRLDEIIGESNYSPRLIGYQGLPTIRSLIGWVAPGIAWKQSADSVRG